MNEQYEVPPEWLDKQLILAFFWRFSVFECALKREGFLKKGRHDQAQPDWGSFAEAIREQFGEQSGESFRAAVQFLLGHPPKRQVVQDGRLGWRPVRRKPGDSDEAFVLDLVKTARNNLFHGGKYPDGPIDEVARNRDILRAALVVLEMCFELHPGIARHSGADAA